MKVIDSYLKSQVTIFGLDVSSAVKRIFTCFPHILLSKVPCRHLPLLFKELYIPVSICVCCLIHFLVTGDIDTNLCHELLSLLLESACFTLINILTSYSLNAMDIIHLAIYTYSVIPSGGVNSLPDFARVPTILSIKSQINIVSTFLSLSVYPFSWLHSCQLQLLTFILKASVWVRDSAVYCDTQ